MIERLNQQLLKKKFDYNKCPLLSKPGEQYIKKLNNKTSPRSLSLFNEFHNLRSVSSSMLYSSSSCMSKVNSSFNTSTNSENSVTPNGTSVKSCLREIYPLKATTATTGGVGKNSAGNQYEKYFILEAIADIFIGFTIGTDVKIMSHADFRAFVK